MSYETLTAKQILSITTPEKLFSGNKVEAETEYRRLAMRWHPDRESGNTTVFAHIATLYDEAIKRIDSGIWAAVGTLQLTDKTGARYEMQYKRRHTFELGDMYIGGSLITYVIDSQYSDLVTSALGMIGHFKFANSGMRAEAERCLPSLQPGGQIVIGDKIIVVFKKPAEYLLLADVMEHCGGKMDPKHAAWILSRLYNLKCYLRWAGIVHNDISPMAYFISPENHTGILVGGWWYAARAGAKMLALPKRTMQYAPNAIITGKKASHIVDAELVRTTGREMLGDQVGSKLLTNASLPKPMVNWLRSAGSDDAFTEYSKWYDKVLIDSFGARRFVKLEISESDFYK